MNSTPRDVSSFEEARQREIEEARIIQQALLPVKQVRTETLEVASRFRPFSEVGGDFLDYFWLPNGTLGLYVGDVVGKGLPAALYATLAMGILRGLNKTGELPSTVIERLNFRLLERVVPERFCMVQYALFEPNSRTLTFANAGLYPSPLLVSKVNCRELGEGGLPCGLMEGARYDLYTFTLAPGDAVLFGTDGLVEAQNPQGEMFRLERLKEICEQNKMESAGTLLKRIFDSLDAFAAGAHQHDDMTACLLKLG
jgi:phosphoserine phosphatase RsbU/P